MTAVGRRDSAHHLLDHPPQLETVLGPVGAQRCACACVRGDHVLGACTLEHADGQHRRALRIDPPSHLGVEGHDDLGDREDRIAPMVGVGRVRGLPSTR